jgi:hypothetical protein
MQWFNFLHFYQPANIENNFIIEAANKSYYRLLRLVEENPELMMTWNVSGCLLLRLEESGQIDFINRLKTLVASGRIELVSSAAYHGFLPLLPEAEVNWQIFENDRILKKYFGEGFSPAGFFLPEMAYSRQLASLVAAAGYKYIILDRITVDPATSRLPIPAVARDRTSGLTIVFRDSEYSSAYPPDKIWPAVKDGLIKDDLIVTATDAELYGLRHEDPTAELEKIVKQPAVKTGTLSQLIETAGLSDVPELDLRPSNWESTAEELLAGEPYALWLRQDNTLQISLWHLAAVLLEANSVFKTDSNYYWFRWHLARGLASCTFWWASGRDLKASYGPLAWSPDEVEKGLNDLVRAARSLASRDSLSLKLASEELALEIKRILWSNHWRQHWLTE